MTFEGVDALIATQLLILQLSSLASRVSMSVETIGLCAAPDLTSLSESRDNLATTVSGVNGLLATLSLTHA